MGEKLTWELVKNMARQGFEADSAFEEYQKDHDLANLVLKLCGIIAFNNTTIQETKAILEDKIERDIWQKLKAHRHLADGTVVEPI